MTSRAVCFFHCVCLSQRRNILRIHAPIFPIQRSRIGPVRGSEAAAGWNWNGEVSQPAKVARQRGQGIGGVCGGDAPQRFRAVPQQRADAVAEGELGGELEDGACCFDRFSRRWFGFPCFGCFSLDFFLRCWPGIGAQKILIYDLNEVE